MELKYVCFVSVVDNYKLIGKVLLFLFFLLFHRNNKYFSSVIFATQTGNTSMSNSVNNLAAE